MILNHENSIHSPICISSDYYIVEAFLKSISFNEITAYNGYHFDLKDIEIRHNMNYECYIWRLKDSYKYNEILSIKEFINTFVRDNNVSR